MMDQNQQSAPAQPQEGGATICITAKPDGTFMVYQDGDEGQEQMGAEDEGAEQAAGQSAEDIDSALQIAKQMLGGQGDAAEPDDDDKAEALFQGGFAGARGQLNKG